MAKIVYDDHYKKLEYFGAPYKGLTEFFENYTPKGRVLDLGCGQGRDAIPIARMGYEVIAVDHSKVGIEGLKHTALREGLKIETRVEDVYKFHIDLRVDMVLLDSMLHFYKNDCEKESAFVSKILRELKEGGVFINFLIKGKGREETFKKIIEQSEFDFQVIDEKYVDYPESGSKYHMLAIRKMASKSIG